MCLNAADHPPPSRCAKIQSHSLLQVDILLPGRQSERAGTVSQRVCALDRRRRADATHGDRARGAGPLSHQRSTANIQGACRPNGVRCCRHVDPRRLLPRPAAAEVPWDSELRPTVPATVRPQPIPAMKIKGGIGIAIGPPAVLRSM